MKFVKPTESVGKDMGSLHNAMSSALDKWVEKCNRKDTLLREALKYLEDYASEGGIKLDLIARIKAELGEK